MITTFFKDRPLTKIFLWVWVVLFLSEFFLHFFGLAIAEHDKIYTFTHDPYIAIYSLTLAGLLIMSSLDLANKQSLFSLTMVSIFLGLSASSWVLLQGGFSILFPVVRLDSLISTSLLPLYFFYFLTWLAWYFKK